MTRADINREPSVSPEDVRPWLEVRRTLQRRQRRRPPRAELAVLLLMFSAALATASWVAPRVDLQLSSLVELASSSGFVRDRGLPRPLVGFQDNVNATEQAMAHEIHRN